jgi:hypothetical protein
LNHATGDSSSITFTALLFCLPLVSLLWAAVGLTVALLHFAFRNYRGVSLSPLASIASVTIFAIFCAVFFHWIWNGPGGFSIPKRLWNALRDFATVPREKDVTQTDEAAGDALAAAVETRAVQVLH